MLSKEIRKNKKKFFDYLHNAQKVGFSAYVRDTDVLYSREKDMCLYEKDEQITDLGD